MPEIKDKTIPPVNILAGDNKSDIRSKIWDYLENYDFAAFPKVPRRRISNFKGSDEVGFKISEMEIFKQARVLRIDPDKPLQEIRVKTLEAGKTLLVPTPKLCNHIVSKIIPPTDADAALLKGCAARQGVQEYSTPIELDEKLVVDLVIVGCVAVSQKGYRVGKGGGLSDLEYAMMASLGIVKSNVPTVTMVHDCQVVDMPDSLFGPHDVPVDFIVTPTRIIECSKKAKPTGIIWSLLTAERLEHVPVLRRIRYRDLKRGLDVRLSGEEAPPTGLEDVVCDALEVLEDRRRRGGPRRIRTSRQSGGDDGTDGGDDGSRGGSNRGGFFGRRRGYGRNRYRGFRNRRFNNTRKTSEGGSQDGHDDEEGHGDSRRRQHNSSGERSLDGDRDRGSRTKGRTNRSFYDSIEGSIYVGALPRSLRVSEFKTEVRERKVNPMRVLWRGSSGFAFLNFRSHQDAEDALLALEGLQISDTPLKLEMARSPTGRRSGGRGGGRIGGRRRRTDEDEEEKGED